MTQPEPLTSTSAPPAYLSLKVGRAVKTGSRSQGYLHYRILADTAQQQLFITLVGNDGDGCHSKEIVPFDKIEQCLHGIDMSKPIASKRFKAAFIGKSANNAGFLAAVLRAELLLAPAPDAVHQHTVQPDWSAWKTALLALAPQAEPYQLEPPKPRIRSTSLDQDSPHENSQSIGQQSQTESPIPPVGTELGTGSLGNSASTATANDISVVGHDAEGDDDEMECLQRSTHRTDLNGPHDEEEVGTPRPAASVQNHSPAKKQGRDKRMPHHPSEKRS